MTIWIFAAIFAGFMADAAVWDAMTLRIPNALTGAMALAAAPSIWLLGPGAAALPMALAVGATALAAGFALFCGGVLGGGDAKLIAASALWLGPAAIADFALMTALFGAVLAAAIIALRTAPAGRMARRRLDMPYALAIAPAGCAAMALRLASAA